LIQRQARVRIKIIKYAKSQAATCKAWQPEIKSLSIEDLTMIRWTMKIIPGMAHSLILVSVLVLATAFCWTSTAHGQIYRWQDEKGHWHFTDSPTSDDETVRQVVPNQEPSPALSPIPTPSPTSEKDRNLLFSQPSMPKA
jgi:hypothetical protein